MAAASATVKASEATASKATPASATEAARSEATAAPHHPTAREAMAEVRSRADVWMKLRRRKAPCRSPLRRNATEATIAWHSGTVYGLRRAGSGTLESIPAGLA